MGWVESVTNNRFVVTRESKDEILDLDNFVCDESKLVIGYIEDVIGPIGDPMYIIGLYPEFRWKQLEEHKGYDNFL